LEIFPNALIIDVKRHGVDVANSLHVRYNKLEKVPNKRRFYRVPFRLFKFLYVNRKIRPKKSFLFFIKKNFKKKEELSLKRGFKMWAEYMEQSQKYVNNKNYLSFKYEDFLNDPILIMKELTSFCGLNSTDDEIKNVIKGVNKSRAYAYLKNQQLANFSVEEKQTLLKYKY